MNGPRTEIWQDNKTGLQWQCDSPGKMSWHDAQAYAETLELAGHEDWRLPSAAELESLLDRSRYRPEMRKAVPFRDLRRYWSSTTFAENTENAWIVVFDGAYVLSYPKKNTYWIRCVRGKARLMCTGKREDG